VGTGKQALVGNSVGKISSRVTGEYTVRPARAPAAPSSEPEPRCRRGEATASAGEAKMSGTRAEAS
jgi:hypothetical protein